MVVRNVYTNNIAVENLSFPSLDFPHLSINADNGQYRRFQVRSENNVMFTTPYQIMHTSLRIYIYIIIYNLNHQHQQQRAYRDQLLTPVLVSQIRPSIPRPSNVTSVRRNSVTRYTAIQYLTYVRPECAKIYFILTYILSGTENTT